MRTIQFFIDFDGTISTVDVVDLVLEKYADERWKTIEREWEEGKIGSRECLARQMALVRATPEELKKTISEVTVDPHFVPFLEKAEELGVLVTIVSDGFDLFIEQILRNNLKEKTSILKALPIFSNRLRKTAEGFKAEFLESEPCRHGCANCKEAVIRKMTSLGDLVFFIGDGLSDRYGAKLSHMAFAKDKLLDYCVKNDIDHIAYRDFKKIEEWLSDNYPMLRKASFLKPPAREPGRKK